MIDQSRDPRAAHLTPGNLRSGFGGGSFRSRDRHLLFAMMFGGGGGGGMSDY